MPVIAAVAQPALWEWSLGDVFFGPNADAHGVQWCMGEIDGWDSPDVRTALHDRPYQHGAVADDTFFTARTLTCPGTIVAPTPAALEAAKDVLRTATRALTADTRLVGNERPPRYLGVRRASRVAFTRIGPEATAFNLALVAPDPRKYAVDPIPVVVRSVNTAGGLPFPWTFGPGLRFTTYADPATVGGVAATNRGNLDAPVDVVFAGPLTRPLLIDQTTGQRISLAVDIPAGRQVVVNPIARTMLLDDTSVYGQQLPGSDFLTVAPGATARWLLIANGSGSATVTIRDSWE